MSTVTSQTVLERKSSQSCDTRANQADIEAASVLSRGFSFEKRGPSYATPDEREAVDVLLQGFPSSVAVDDRRAAVLSSCEVESPKHVFMEQTSSSCAVCVTPDTDSTKKEQQRQQQQHTVDSFHTAIPLPDPSHASEETLQRLDTLSSTFLICSNALVDQIKYLPDSVVPPADYSYVEQDKSMEKQAETLRREFSHLLWEGDTQRANFLAVPKDVLELLRGVWNLSEDDSTKDRIGRRLVPVQSFFPNLLNYLLRSPGFPTVSDVFDSDIFRSFGKKKVKGIEREFKQLIRQALEDMGYPCDGQEIDFYLSFMRTCRRTIVQDPHIDFKFESVDPWYVDESSCSRRKSKRGRKLDYKERVPFIAFFPLTPDGMAVEVWEAREDHGKGRDGVLVHIPFGSMMIARGDLVHAGGFSNSGCGNPRCHLYIYRSGGEVHDINTSNTYTMEIDGKTVRMSQIYLHGPGI